MNIALFPKAEVVDFWARYRDDLWLDHDGDGYRLAPQTQLWLTPGHTEEDMTLIVEADDARLRDDAPVVGTGPHAARSTRYASDQAAIERGRERVRAAAPTSSSRGTAGRSASATERNRLRPGRRRGREPWPARLTRRSPIPSAGAAVLPSRPTAWPRSCIRRVVDAGRAPRATRCRDAPPPDRSPAAPTAPPDPAASGDPGAAIDLDALADDRGPGRQDRAGHAATSSPGRDRRAVRRGPRVLSAAVRRRTCD